MSNKIARLGIILFGITAVTGLLLGIVQHITSGPIAEQRRRQKEDALEATLPGARSFKEVAVENGGIISEIYQGLDGEKNRRLLLYTEAQGFRRRAYNGLRHQQRGARYGYFHP
jgi:Na+-translocating ferredoxin:NAD+ oxidoreductase RnfG subunit